MRMRSRSGSLSADGSGLGSGSGGAVVVAGGVNGEERGAKRKRYSERMICVEVATVRPR